jgi:hypothetical protein
MTSVGTQLIELRKKSRNMSNRGELHPDKPKYFYYVSEYRIAVIETLCKQSHCDIFNPPGFEPSPVLICSSQSKRR